MITIETLKSSPDIPDPLVLLCLKQIVEKPVNLDRFRLPPELGRLLVSAFRDYAITNRASQSACSNFFKHFKHKFIPLTSIDFSNLPISEDLFYDFLEEYQEQLEEINISKCPNLEMIEVDMKKLNRILKANKELKKTLIIGQTLSCETEKVYFTSIPKNEERVFDSDLQLKKLVLHKIFSPVDGDEFSINTRLSRFLSPNMCDTLKYLDLSLSAIGKGTALMQLKSLEILILYNCVMTYPDVISTICQLRKLRVLDLSRTVIETDDSSLPAEDMKLLDSVVGRLPLLARLDISGTNLVGGKERNISAFESRSDKPFEFLGLFHTSKDAAYRSYIPAITVAGEANELQMLNACEAYMDRPEQLSNVLNDLYNYYKTITSEKFDMIDRILDIVLYILSRHLHDEQVIIYTTAALYCIVKLKATTRSLNDARVRRTLTSKLLDVMHYHSKSRVILINGGLSLLFLPDIICEHSRVASISLLMCRDDDPRTQGFGTTLLNTLACQVGGDQKVFIGNLEAIETMLRIIRTKVNDETCDEILETAWSTLWNITDETPVNCQRFLEHRGLEAFESCMEKFRNNKEVLRNMMGLLGNVAECKHLRVQFMKEKYIACFATLLSLRIDGIECSYNACGILAHLLSEGQAFWDQQLNDDLYSSISYDTISQRMRATILRWPINSKRNINYRSFEPIVRLLDVGIVADAQYWAVFALTNLTRINPAKYCPMLLPHDGLNKLRRLAMPDVTTMWVRDLAQVAIYQYERFNSEGTLAGLEQCRSRDLETIRNFRAESTLGDATSDFGDLVF